MMLSPDQKEQLREEARRFYFASPHILPLLEKRRKQAEEKLLSAFRQGETNLVARVAELAAFESLQQELKTQENIYLTLEGEKGT